MRALAQRSAEAARQTAALIEEAVGSAGKCVELNAAAFAGVTRVGEHAKRT